MKLKTIILTVILSLLCVLVLVQNQENKAICQDFSTIDAWMEREFESSKDMLVYHLHAKEFDFLDFRQLTRFQMAAVYGTYLEHSDFGGDPEWGHLAQALDLLKHEAIFSRLTDDDFNMIVSFLNDHHYRNQPEITKADLAPIVDRLNSLLNEFSSDGRE